jgi:hypothetical protein
LSRRVQVAAAVAVAAATAAGVAMIRSGLQAVDAQAKLGHARRLDHLRLRTSSEWAASSSAVRASSSPHRLDPAFYVGLARLLARRCQAETRAHVARGSEAVRPVDRPSGVN